MRSGLFHSTHYPQRSTHKGQMTMHNGRMTAPIIDVTEASFQQDVIDRSREAPVVVDFWSVHCPPCRALKPLLEQAAREASGSFVLAKVNVDEAPNLAGAFGVSSIPAVFALRDGQVVDSFIGLLPEADLRRWLESIQPTAAERLDREAKSLETSDPAAAEAKYRAALQLSPDDAAARIGLMRAILAQGRWQECQAILDELAERGYLEADAEAVAAELALHQFAAEQPDIAACQKAAASQPGDAGVQLALAKALAGAGQFEPALAAALAVVRRDRAAAGESARQIMVHVFRRLGEEHDLTSEYRRKLSAALY